MSARRSSCHRLVSVRFSGHAPQTRPRWQCLSSAARRSSLGITPLRGEGNGRAADPQGEFRLTFLRIAVLDLDLNAFLGATTTKKSTSPGLRRRSRYLSRYGRAACWFGSGPLYLILGRLQQRVAGPRALALYSRRIPATPLREEDVHGKRSGRFSVQAAIADRGITAFREGDVFIHDLPATR